MSSCMTLSTLLSLLLTKLLLEILCSQLAVQGQVMLGMACSQHAASDAWETVNTAGRFGEEGARLGQVVDETVSEADCSSFAWADRLGLSGPFSHAQASIAVVKERNCRYAGSRWSDLAVGQARRGGFWSGRGVVPCLRSTNPS